MTVNVSKPAINVREKLAELDKPTGVAGEAMLRAETPQEQFNLIGAGRRNLIMNGAMQVAQRATSVTSVSTEGYKTVDRFKWTMDTTSSVYTLSQSTDVPSGQGFANSFKAETTTADATLDANCQIRFEQRFEGQDVQQLAKGTSNAKSVTLSFWVKAFQTGTYILNLQDTDNSRLIAATYTVNSSATWEYKTVTFAGDTTGAFTNDNNISLVVHWYLSAGSNYTSGTLASAWESLTTANRAVSQTVDIADSTSNYWQITGVQLEVGKVATPFEHRSYGEELALCQRYFQTLANGELVGSKNTPTRMRITGKLVTEMRAQPTVSRVSGTTVVFQGVGVGVSSTNTAAAQGANSGLRFMAFDLDGFPSLDNRSYGGADASSTTAVFHVDAEL